MTKRDVSIRQIKAACALLGWSKADLAREAGVPVADLAAIEAGNSGPPAVLRNIDEALRRGGIMFISENETSPNGGAGLRLRPSHADEGLRPEDLTSANDG